jgi:hypothetical protein
MTERNAEVPVVRLRRQYSRRDAELSGAPLRQAAGGDCQANSIAPDTMLKVGQALSIPGAKSTRVATANPAHTPQTSSAAHVPVTSIPADSQPRERVATAEAGAPFRSGTPRRQDRVACPNGQCRRRIPLAGVWEPSKFG